MMTDNFKISETTLIIKKKAGNIKKLQPQLKNFKNQLKITENTFKR